MALISYRVNSCSLVAAQWHRLRQCGDGAHARCPYVVDHCWPACLWLSL